MQGRSIALITKNARKPDNAIDGTLKRRGLQDASLRIRYVDSCAEACAWRGAADVAVHDAVSACGRRPDPSHGYVMCVGHKRWKNRRM